MKVAVVGATGLVGTKMLQVLAERKFPVTELIPVASERSIGKLISFQGKEYPVVSMEEAIRLKPAVAIFSAGGSTSLEWAPKFAEAGIPVIDNSSAWRMDPTKKLVVPEINADELTKDDLIIANPNCSTIQMVVALNPLHKRYGIKRIVVSTYQSVTGTGIKAVDQLQGERRKQVAGDSTDYPMAYKYPIDLNVIPQIDVFLDNGYTKEEMKMVVVVDDPATQQYPMPMDAHERDEVFVGRIRRDESQPNTLNCWIVSDNLRKGAATNAVQIAEYMIGAGLIS